MSHRSTSEKELEVKLELYLGFGTFGKVGFWWSWWILFAFKSLKMVRNDTKKVQKVFFVIFGFFEFFWNFWFFSQNDAFRLFAHDYPFLIEKSFKSQWNIDFSVPIILLKFSPKSIWILCVPPTHRWVKIAGKSFKMGLLGTQVSRDWDRKTTRSKFSPFLQISLFQNAFRFDLISFLRHSILTFDIK